MEQCREELPSDRAYTAVAAEIDNRPLKANPTSSPDPRRLMLECHCSLLSMGILQLQMTVYKCKI